MGAPKNVHNLRDSSETHGTITNTTNTRPSPSTDRNPIMNPLLNPDLMVTPEQARQLAAELIAGAVAAERRITEAVPTLRTFQVSMSVMAPAGMSDADVAGIIDLTDWAAGPQLDRNVTIDDVQIMEKQAPFGTTTVASLFMDNITIDSYRDIPRVYLNAAADWLDFGHEQDGVGKLAKLLWALDTNREVQ
jgi:hypothetical protein